MPAQAAMNPQSSMWPRLALATALALAVAAPAFAIDIKVEDTEGKATIALTGQVVAGDGLKVRSIVGGIGGSKPIVAELAFAGGVWADAMSMGRFFHQIRIRTVVPAKLRCNSPCPLALVGGRDPITGKGSYLKYSSGALGFTGVVSNYADKEYTIADLDAAVATTQRDILRVADYLHDVGADINMLRYYQSVLKSGEVQYITNEQALDLGIAILFEETGQVIEPVLAR
jgi:hypothetical protein